MFTYTMLSKFRDTIVKNHGAFDWYLCTVFVMVSEIQMFCSIYQRLIGGSIA